MSVIADGYLAPLQDDNHSITSANSASSAEPQTPIQVFQKIPTRIIQNAAGIAIFTCMRSGLWMTGSGGSGILIARKADGTWSPPSGILLHTEGAVYPIVAGRIVNMNAFLAFLDHVHGLLTTTYHNTPIVLMVSPQWARPHTEMIARYVFENTRTPALCMIHSGLATTYGVRWTNATVVDIGFEKVDVSCIYEGRVVAHRMLGNFNPER
ncbi:hypothetical protein BN1723_018951, partial [Verticillium longisporum]